MTESVKSHALLKTLAAFAVFGLLGFVVWPHLDQSESRVVLVGTVLTIALAFYSIFDLQKQRNEKLLHTLDRLLRAAFVAMTLVFVVEIATKPAPKVGTTVIYEKVPVILADELNALEATWTPDSVTPVIEKHFAKLNLGEPIMLRVANSKHFVTFQPTSGGVKIIEVR